MGKKKKRITAKDLTPDMFEEYLPKSQGKRVKKKPVLVVGKPKAAPVIPPGTSSYQDEKQGPTIGRCRFTRCKDDIRLFFKDFFVTSWLAERDATWIEARIRTAMPRVRKHLIFESMEPPEYEKAIQEMVKTSTGAKVKQWSSIR